MSQFVCLLESIRRPAKFVCSCMALAERGTGLDFIPNDEVLRTQDISMLMMECHLDASIEFQNA